MKSRLSSCPAAAQSSINSSIVSIRDTTVPGVTCGVVRKRLRGPTDPEIKAALSMIMRHSAAVFYRELELCR